MELWRMAGGKNGEKDKEREELEEKNKGQLLGRALFPNKYLIAPNQ